jgi:hypothetical protein
MTDTQNAQLLELLGAVEAALESLDGQDGVSDALYQCGRLRHALGQAHSEGARFAAFTLGRLVTTRISDDESTRKAYDTLKQAMVEAGHRLAH